MSSREIKKEKIVGPTNNKIMKGCNCKRTKCLKNFCECFKNSKFCSELCKCIECRNNAIDKNASNADLITNESKANAEPVANENWIVEEEVPISCYTVTPKKPLNILTPDIIESTIECVISQAIECENNNLDLETSERMILGEFGRCMEEIMRLSNAQNIAN